jgi:uncharacterized HAD superfamily protein
VSAPGFQYGSSTRLGLRMNVRTIADMNATILGHLSRVPADVEVVAGVPRSGLLAANMVALHLNLPLTDIEGLENGRLLATGKRALRHGSPQGLLNEPRNVLVVDDCVSQGTELERIKGRLAELPHSFTYLTVYAFPEGAHRADITFETVPRPAAFEWSLFHSEVLRQVCLDIDGVLCRDATAEEDDDGERYRHFLAEVPPLLRPTVPARALITSRLERYRPETEDWLARHGVRYQELIMMDHPTAQARQRAARQTAFKARAYEQTGALLFVESSPGQAHEIAQLSGKPVLAITTGQVERPSWHARVAVRVQRLRWWGRRLRRVPWKVLSIVRSLRDG